jgi:hypothetical protein
MGKFSLPPSAFACCGVALAIWFAGCERPPEMRAAQSGDAAALRRAIIAKERTATLSNRAAADLARVVASRDVRRSNGADAVARVGSVGSCALKLDDALAARMAIHDAAGALAAVMRVDQGTLSPERVRSYGADPMGDWRAVGARGLVRSEDDRAREHAFQDRDPTVRRQAIRASRDARARSDMPYLVHAARTDPDPTIQTEAVRALGALPSPPPDRTLVDELRDIWASSSEDLRGEVAWAWSRSDLWNAGGREALRFVIETGHGSAVGEAAAAVLRRSDADKALVSDAVVRLTEVIANAPTGSRLHAIAEAPSDHATVMDAISAAARDGDPAVRVAALGRLAQAGRRSATTELEALAQPGESTSRQARMALAIAGDRRVQGWLEQSLEAADARERLEAAVGLVRLGLAARAAPLLADSDADVRMRAACEILMSRP